MTHALGADEAVAKALHVSRFSAQEDDFEAVFAVEVCVEGGDDQIVVLVLDAGELIREQAGVVVVDEGHGGDDGGVARGDGGVDEAVADKVAKGLGAVLVALVGDEAVESVE